MPPEGHVKYYTIKVPLQVTASGDEGVKGVEANWLDHMTQHFNNGASLVDGYFHLGDMKGELAVTWSELTRVLDGGWRPETIFSQSDSRKRGNEALSLFKVLGIFYCPPGAL